MLKLLSLAVGAEVTWAEVVLALSLSVVAYFFLIIVLSI